MREPQPLKMYVLVRKELDETYRNVQGGHASIEYTLKFSHTDLLKEWQKEPYLIHLGVRFPSELIVWQERLSRFGIKFCTWCEPDLDGQMTAIACIDTGEIFKDLPLA